MSLGESERQRDIERVCACVRACDTMRCERRLRVSLLRLLVKQGVRARGWEASRRRLMARIIASCGRTLAGKRGEGFRKKAEKTSRGTVGSRVIGRLNGGTQKEGEKEGAIALIIQ